MPTVSKPEPLPPRENRLGRERRAAVLETAARVFLEKGFEGTSMADIIAAAGGSKASIYRQFENKEGLFAAVVTETIRRLADQVFELPDDTTDIAAKLADIGQRFAELLIDDTARALRRVSLHAAEKFPDIAAVFFDNGPRPLVARLTAFIRRAHAHGDLHAPDADIAAWQFVMLCQAKYIYPSMVAGTPRPSPQELKTTVDAAVRTFMAAFGPGTNA